MGMGYSPSRGWARGDMTRPRGTPVCFFMSGVSGTLGAGARYRVVTRYQVQCTRHNVQGKRYRVTSGE